MKVSIAWIFDHIDADYLSIDAAKLMREFNKTVAEIEGWKKVELNLSNFTFAQVISVEGETVSLASEEWNKNLVLPIRDDVTPEQYYLIVQCNNEYEWASMDDLGSDKELLLPAFYVTDEDKKGNWKKHFNAIDYIFEVDNKSITHRPDMWGHRGFAREIATMLDLPFKPLDEFVATKPVKSFEYDAPSNETNPFAITIQDPSAIKRFATVYLKEVAHYPSLLRIAARLARIDSRPIDTLVDFTNYIMFDLGQPMHAFDAATLPNKHIIARRAHKNETLIMLDEEKLTLTHEDIVIADGDKAVSLGGVMGGHDTGITSQTKSVLLESANFDATTIRRTAERYKKRTDASSRFEKSLDPNQNIDALQRFIKLLDQAQIPYAAFETISSVGSEMKPGNIVVSHSFIERHIGAKIKQAFVEKILQKLGFTLEIKQIGQDVEYHITVPTFRATKDITIPEDIVEEIGRYYGYDNIEQELPSLQLKASNLSPVFAKRKIKQLLSDGCLMRELSTYSFFDESFLHEIGWAPGKIVEVTNPVTQNYYRLVTTLLPNLFKAINRNGVQKESLRFYEWGRIWQPEKEIKEQQVISGILYEQKKAFDFYDGKVVLEQLFNLLHMPITWHQVEKSDYPWFAPYQTAYLKLDNAVIGVFGVIDSLFLNKITPGGAACAFEVNADVLSSYQQPLKKFVPISKYQQVVRDVSMLMPVERTTAILHDLITQQDKRIASVALVDFFEKEEWQGKRSLTFRITLQDQHKTLTKEEVDTIISGVEDQMKKQGAELR